MEVGRNHIDYLGHIIQSEKIGLERRIDLPKAVQQGDNRTGTRRLVF